MFRCRSARATGPGGFRSRPEQGTRSFFHAPRIPGGFFGACNPRRDSGAGSPALPGGTRSHAESTPPPAVRTFPDWPGCCCLTLSGVVHLKLKRAGLPEGLGIIKRRKREGDCKMRMANKLFVMVFFYLSSITACLALAPPNPQMPGMLSGLLPGFGSSAPQTRNVSQDPRVAVYEWKIGSERIFQINSSTGEIIDVLTVMPNGRSPMLAFSMPGTAAASNDPQPMASGGQCPCSTSVLATGPWGEVIGVFGASGDLLDVIVVCSNKDSCTIHGQ